ncbi:hypothetical protein HID58_000563 [Brassica napus]|uniref:PPPDE domain-containing protein n=1 Tax=Brassica napus TaxID=3708 RepID=A0ABQ8EJW7_BRANA|nr:hypothetical protein HID58_000563 [Brassica napus]
MMFCRNVCVRRKKKKNPGSVPVYLNVYDLTPMNVYGYWLGIGIYHSGLEVHGVEYGYGAHEHSSTGIFKVEPKKCPGFTFRKSILVGETEMKAKEIGSFMEELSDEYQGSKYHLITRNCNHFCNDVCLKLTQKSIPSWVNRLARLGFLCNCVLPASLNEMKVKQVGKDGKLLEVGESKKNKKKKKQKKARSRSGPLASSSDSRLDNNKPSHARSISTASVVSTQSVMEDQTKDSVAWLDQRKGRGCDDDDDNMDFRCEVLKCVKKRLVATSSRLASLLPSCITHDFKMPSHKSFMIKKKLAKKMRQNRPIPHWIRLRTDNTIRATMVGTRNVLLSLWFEFGYILVVKPEIKLLSLWFELGHRQCLSSESEIYNCHCGVQCQAQALAQNQARILSESSRLFVFCSI